MKKVCEYDQVEFEASRASARFCSPKCRVLFGRGLKPLKSGELKSAQARFDKKIGQLSKEGLEKMKKISPIIAPLSFDGRRELPEADEVVHEVAPETTHAPELVDDSIPLEAARLGISVKEYNSRLKAFEKMGLQTVEWITTGIPEFDALTQIPRGRITQIQGPYAVGKTTLCLNMIQGLTGKARVLYIDTEAALNPKLLMTLGLNPKNFTLYNESAFIEDIYDTILGAVEKATYDMIILDSLAATTFRTEAANDAANANIGQKAKIVGKLMRIVPMELKRTGTALVIINQEREVIGGYAPIKYTPGGMGVPYAASLMVSLKTTKGARFPKSGPPFKGHTVTAEIIKSKVNEPWRKAEFKLFYGGRG